MRANASAEVETTQSCACLVLYRVETIAESPQRQTTRLRETPHDAVTVQNATDTEHTTRLAPSSSDSARHTTDTDQRESNETERREREARREERERRAEEEGGAQGGRRGGDGECVMDVGERHQREREGKRKRRRGRERERETGMTGETERGETEKGRGKTEIGSS